MNKEYYMDIYEKYLEYINKHEKDNLYTLMPEWEKCAIQLYDRTERILGELGLPYPSRNTPHAFHDYPNQIVEFRGENYTGGMLITSDLECKVLPLCFLWDSGLECKVLPLCFLWDSEELEKFTC